MFRQIFIITTVQSSAEVPGTLSPEEVNLHAGLFFSFACLKDMKTSINSFN